MPVVDLSARRKPVTYSVHITHWDWHLEIFAEDVADDDRSRSAVADALARAAEVFSKPKGR